MEDRPVVKEHKLRTTLVVAHGGDVLFLNKVQSDHQDKLWASQWYMICHDQGFGLALLRLTRKCSTRTVGHEKSSVLLRGQYLFSWQQWGIA